MFKKFYLFAVSFMLMLCLSTASADSQEKLTILIYMSGSDLESRSGEASKDLEEMAAAIINDDITVAVLTGGSSKWFSDIPTEKNILWHVKPDGLA